MPFLKTNSDNLTPLTRTPWAGSRISQIKSSYLPKSDWPARIGESWEVSVEPSFPSRIEGSPRDLTLQEAIQANANSLLGEHTVAKFGTHLPLLLKWIEASSALSVQLHPEHTNPALKPTECGKPEAWLVVEAAKDSLLYLGFKSGISRKQIEHCLTTGKAEECLHAIHPKPFQYIFIPPGCVHALGSQVLVVEPQLVLANRTGVTWRVFDWNRRYNTQGVETPEGEPRALHLHESLAAIDWNLPRGEELEQELIIDLFHHSEQRYVPQAALERSNSTHKSYFNPIAAALLPQEESQTRWAPLLPQTYAIVSVWSGLYTFFDQSNQQELTLCGGESALITAETGVLLIRASSCNGEMPGGAIFSL